MNTPVTRDLVMDLLPAYLSGDCSEATKVLVESYMKEDTGFAQMVKSEAKIVLPTLAPTKSNELELKALRATKRKIRRRSWHLAFAIFFSLLAVSYQYGPDGIKWMWEASPLAAIALSLVGIMFWVHYFKDRLKLKPTGL